MKGYSIIHRVKDSKFELRFNGDFLAFSKTKIGCQKIIELKERRKAVKEQSPDDYESYDKKYWETLTEN